MKPPGNALLLQYDCNRQPILQARYIMNELPELVTISVQLSDSLGGGHVSQSPYVLKGPHQGVRRGLYIRGNIFYVVAIFYIKEGQRVEFDPIGIV